MDKFKLVCFDVDGTLVNGVSWLILTEGLGCSPQAHMDIFQQALEEEITFEEGERKIVKMYQESGKATKSSIEKIAQKLELDSFFANSSIEFGEDGVVKKIHYIKDQGEVKVRQLKKLARQLHINLKEIVFIGESWNDVEAFKATGNGIAVHCLKMN